MDGREGHPISKFQTELHQLVTSYYPPMGLLAPIRSPIGSHGFSFDTCRAVVRGCVGDCAATPNRLGYYNTVSASTAAHFTTAQKHGKTKHMQKSSMA